MATGKWTRYHDIFLLLLSAAVVDGPLSAAEQEAVRIRMLSWSSKLSPARSAAILQDVTAKLRGYSTGARLQRAIHRCCDSVVERAPSAEYRQALAQQIVDIACADGSASPAARGVAAEIVGRLQLPLRVAGGSGRLVLAEVA